MSRANLSKKGPRSGLSSEESSGLGESGGGFLPERAGEGLDREGEGDGSFLFGVRGGFCGGGSGTVIRSGWASGGDLTETSPGIG